MARSNWPISSWIRLAVFGLFLPLFVLALFLYVAMNAASLQAAEIGPADSGPTATAAVDEADAAALLDGWQRSSIGRAYVKPAAAAEVITPTTLSVTILSTPWAVLDSNKPGGTQADPAPRVFMVEARVLNTGDYDAVDLELVLDYNEDPDNDWLLLKGEVPLREPAGNLAPGEEFYGYWFASYPITFSAGHQYTVTAAAELVDPVSTSANFFFEPTPGATVMTDEFLSTGSSGQSQIDTNIVVGVAYTIAVEYNLGSDPGFLIFTPVGNPGFDAGSTRLTGASVRLYNQVDITGTTISDRLFISNVPTMTNDLPPDTAEIVYTMLPVTPASTELCPFMAVGNYIQKPKFDQFYCDPTAEPPTSVIIEGDLSYSMTKSVSSDFVQQDGILTYTINYTNTGEVPLNQIWVWDDLDPAVASVVGGTVSPAPNADESNEHRVAWYLGEIPAPPNPGYTGTLTFQALVDGGGADLADGTDVINHAFFGVNPGSLPPRPAFTATITSTIQAPSIALAKSDGLESVGNGQALTYTVTAANNGSVTASSVVLTDVLPALVDLAGTPSPAPDDVQGQTLVWTSLADLAPGETVTVTIPVTVSQDAASFTQLVNQAYFEYDNDLDYTFDVETASDTTEVARVAGYVEGYAFEDTVPDGTFDGDEPRLSGVQITLPAALTPTVTTDVDGYYRFRIEVEEPISVTAGLPAGFFRTTPGKAFLDSTFDVTKTVNFGYASTSSDFAIIYGTVFADNNHDGNQDLGENGLPGVTISATAAITSPVFSNEFGQYTLGFEDSGAVSVEETNPAGYVSTTPDLVPTNVVTGSNQGSPVNFGDFLGIRIEGKVFDDLNVNGQDDGESGLAGAGVAAGSDSLTTDGSGLYTLFARVTGGPIVITETDPGGYVSTNAITGTAMSRVDANRLRIDSPVSGTVYSDGLFGDVLASSVISITGVVWDDNGAGGGALANGQRDGSEPGLAGVWLSASSGMAAQSLLDGSYTLYAPPGVAVTVTEKNPAGYVSTNAVPGNSAQKIDHDNLRVEGLSAGQSSAGNQFGDVLSNTVAAFSGNVWNDNGANGGVAADGLWQQGQEPTLAGALVSLSSGMNMTTGPDGAYLLYGPPGVPITITELNPAGYVSTGAIPGAGAVRHDDDNLVVASPVANQLYAGNLFGDALPADVAVEKSADPDPVVAGTGLTYTVVVSNHGPSNASGVVVTDTLPAAVDFVSYLASQGTFSNTTGVWTVGDLAVDGSATLTIEVNVNSEATVSLTNSVLASAIQKDINTENNTFTLITGIDGEVDLALSKSDDPNPVVAGTSLTYRLELDNIGPSKATGVTVVEELPAAVSFVSYQASSGVFSDT
ncbi:MAG TPA: hypothetical protein VLE70_15010, partial [Anaerolineae bacterium]|nr:hypothetical protein [Anaerolineae bacterium]